MYKMSKTIYTLANGTKVYSLAEAEASKQKYSVSYETIDEEIKISEKAKARRWKLS